LVREDEMMMRAALILGGLGILTAMELAAPPRAGKAAVEPPLALLMPQPGNLRDTLTPADRVAVTHLLYDAPFQPVSPAEKISPATDAQDTAKNIDSHRRGASAGPAAVVLPKPRPRPTAPKLAESKPAEPRHAAAKPAKPGKAAGPDRPKAITETGSCQANAFAGLLKALNLPTGCET
jgi:hypothetical protein